MSLLALLADAARARTTHARSRRNVRRRGSAPTLERLESLQLLSGYTYDFSGYKFNDKNSDGYFDYRKESGLKDWDIRAYKDINYNGKLDQYEYDKGPAAEDWTDKNGKYDLWLGKGNYIIVEVQQDGWNQTAPYRKVLSSSLDTGDETLGSYGFAAYVHNNSYYNNFGNHQQPKDKYGFVSGYKYEDSNANGTHDDGEPYLEGWTIDAFLDSNGNGKLDSYEYNAGPADSEVTDANGYYQLKVKGGYKYIIVEELQDTWHQSQPTTDVVNVSNTNLGDFGYAIYVKAGKYYTGNDFGNYQNASKTGFKYEDVNGNGAYDDGDKLLSGWTILAFADNGDGTLDQDEFDAGPAATSVTDASGNYALTELTPGSYIIVEQLKSGWFQSEPTTDVVSATGTGLGENGYAVTLASGQNETNNPFGNYRQAKIEGTKFEDKNHNGYRDKKEHGLKGWEIQAYADTDGNGTLSEDEYNAGAADTDYTDYYGNYTLYVRPGNYIIVEVLQKNWKQTYPDDVVLEDHLDHLGKYGYSVTVTSGQKLYDQDFGNFYKKRDKHDYGDGGGDYWY